MGYVPQFNNDIFISYRHASNEAHDKWIDTFCKELRARLLDLVGDVTFWRDEANIRAGDQWRAEIATALDTTAIFLAIISRTYFDSDVCRKEMDRFLGRAKSATEALQSRIVPIFKQPQKTDQEFPQELTECHRHEFFRIEAKDSHRFKEYNPDNNDETSPLYWETLERLAQDLMDSLEKLKGYVRKKTVGTIFLACVGPELYAVREKLRSDLQQHGYLVIPEREYFWNASDCKEKLIEHLENAKLCVHLVARTNSIESDTPEHSRLQLELAVATMKRREMPLPLIWLQPSDTTDETKHDLVEFIEQVLSNEGVEYLEDSLEEFKTLIYAKLPSPPRAQVSTTSDHELALIVEESDISATGEINAFFVQKLGLDTKRAIFSGSNPRNPSFLEKSLACCEKCLIFWGNQPEEWVSDILSLDLLAGHLNEERLSVYISQPATNEKATFLSAKARTILGTNGINEGGLREFLEPTETT